MKRRRIMFLLCTISLVGSIIAPTSANLQSVGKRSKVQSSEPAVLPIKGRVSVDEYYDVFLDLKAREESLTSGELLLYKQLFEELGVEYEIRNRLRPTETYLPFGVAAVGGEDCAGAPLFTTSFMDSDSTTGHVDNYDPATATTCPATGGGTSFISTGAGEDLVYRLNSPTSGTAVVDMDPTDTVGTDDLALYVISPGPCPPNPPTPNVFTTGCIVGDDSGGGGTAEMVTFSVTAGVDYFIVVDGFAGADGPYNLTCTVSAPPVNDVCSMATAVACPSTTMQSVAFATGGTSPDPNPSCVGTHSRTVWYSYTPPVNQNVTVSTAGSDYDTGLTIWCPPCPTPTEELACNDDFGGTLQSQVTFRAKAGQTYLIEVWDFGGAGPGGMLTLSLSCVNLPAAPPNDECATATVVTLPAGGGVFMECVDTTNATQPCGEPGIGSNSVWWKVTAGKAGFLDLGTFGFSGRQSTDFDTTIHVRTACPPGGTVLAQNDDFGGDLRSRVVIPVVAGQMVFVRVAGFGGDTGTACVRFVNF